MKVSGLSYSSITNYDMCNFKYYLQAVLGFQDESGPAATIGHISHHILEILSKASMLKHDPASKIWNLDYLFKICFERYYVERPEICEKIDPKKLVDVSKGVVDIVNSDYSPIRDNTIAVELPFNIAITDPGFKINDKHLSIRGRIDRIDQIDANTLEIIDYKSGTRTNYNSTDRHKKTSEDLYNDLQPRLYHLACAYLFGHFSNFIVTMYYLVDGGPVSVPFSEADIGITKELLRRKYQAISANEDPQRTKSWKCTTLCPFGKDGSCDRLWAEKEQVGVEFMTEKYKALNYGNKRK